MNGNITERKSRIIKSLEEASIKPNLTLEEELQLIERIKDGEAALRELRNANLRIVVSVAKEYQRESFTLEELIKIGNKGLEEAAKSFDEARGFKFISYAVWFIKQSIQQAIEK